MEKLEVGRDAPGALPGSAPDSAISRNTVEIQRLHAAVGRLIEHLKASSEQLETQSLRVAEEGRRLEERQHALTDLAGGVSALQETLDRLSAQLASHEEALRENTEAVRKASRF